MTTYELFFFFSSRRRHTRSTRDWSSDVCSSDLVTRVPPSAHPGAPIGASQAIPGASGLQPCDLEWRSMSDRYRLGQLLARGGMAEVYLGTMGGAEGFEKPVAIKRILPHLAQDDEMARMFLAEAKLASFLSHQNIVQVFDIGRAPEGLFIVMELIDGWDLALIIAQASENHLTLPPALSAFIASQVLTGLCHAYRQSYQGTPIVV